MREFHLNDTCTNGKEKLSVYFKAIVRNFTHLLLHLSALVRWILFVELSDPSEEMKGSRAASEGSGS